MKKKILEFLLTAAVGALLFVAAIESAIWALDQGEWMRVVGLALFIGFVSYMMGAAVVLSIKAGWKEGKDGRP